MKRWEDISVVLISYPLPNPVPDPCAVHLLLLLPAPSCSRCKVFLHSKQGCCWSFFLFYFFKYISSSFVSRATGGPVTLLTTVQILTHSCLEDALWPAPCLWNAVASVVFSAVFSLGLCLPMNNANWEGYILQRWNGQEMMRTALLAAAMAG